ncbi:hypothetical protein Droror1_Dr00028076 [Drosera rotundifolia]
MDSSSSQFGGCGHTCANSGNGYKVLQDRKLYPTRDGRKLVSYRGAPKRFLFWASSVLLSIGPMHWAHFIEVGCQAKVVLLLFAALICDHPSLPGIVPHRKKERRAPTCRSANVKRGVEPELAN